jgi:hypothetical protein
VFLDRFNIITKSNLNKVFLGVLLFVFIFKFNVHYSQLINFEKIAELSKDSIKSIWVKSKIPKFITPVNNGVTIYHVNYYTKWIDGERIKASGRYYVPKTDNEYPLVIYNHGTRVKKGRPKLQGGESKICLIFCTDGYGVISPDYIGLGEGEKEHLYCHMESEADAGIDFLLAIKELDSILNTKRREELFLTGYSQGGHAAMSIHKKVERDFFNKIKITASAPLSGPYNISGVQGELMFQEYSQPHYLPYLLNGLNIAYNIWSIDSYYKIYKSPYDSILPKLFDGNHKVKTINKALPKIPVDILKPELVFQYKNQPDFIIHKLLKMNDVSNWKPIAPIQMCYCESDEQVLYNNAIVTRENMLALGAKNVRAKSAGKKFGHNQCAGFSVIYTKYYFDSFLKGSKKGRKGPLIKRTLLGIYKLFIKKK